MCVEIFDEEKADILAERLGNAIDEVKNRADIVIESNDEEGIALFIEEKLFGGREDMYADFHM